LGSDDEDGGLSDVEGVRWPRRSAGALVAQEAIEAGGDPGGRLRRELGRVLAHAKERGIMGARGGATEGTHAVRAAISLCLLVVRQALTATREAAAARRSHLRNLSAALGLSEEEVGKLPATSLAAGLGLGAGTMVLPVFVPLRRDDELRLLEEDGTVTQVLDLAGVTSDAALGVAGRRAASWTIDAGAEGALKKLVAAESEL